MPDLSSLRVVQVLEANDGQDRVDSLLRKYNIEYPYGGFSIGPGWKDLVEGLILLLLSVGWDKNLSQVKEKFGGLRFYVGEAADEMYEFIDRAEELSFTICERCGESGKPREGGWTLTLCDGCNGKREEERSTRTGAKT